MYEGWDVDYLNDIVLRTSTGSFPQLIFFELQKELHHPISPDTTYPTDTCAPLLRVYLFSMSTLFPPLRMHVFFHYLVCAFRVAPTCTLPLLCVYLLPVSTFSASLSPLVYISLSSLQCVSPINTHLVFVCTSPPC